MDSLPSSIVKVITLDSAAAEIITRDILNLNKSPYDGVNEYLPLLHGAFVSHLPSAILNAVWKFRESPTGPGVLVIRGLPIDPSLPPTPVDGGRSEVKTTYVSEASLLGTSLLFGEVYGLAQVKKGEIVQTVAPVEGKFASQSNEGYGSELKMHTEMSFHPTFRPHYFFLLCLREDKYKESLTYISDNKEVVSQLTEAEVELLRDPRFIVHGPESFKAHWKPVQKPIISGPLDRPELVLGLHSDIDAPSAAAADALAHLKQVIESSIKGVHLERGDLLVVDNRRVMHGRSTFKCDFDGHDRWLQRVHIREHGTLWKQHSSTSFPNRVFDGFTI